MDQKNSPFNKLNPRMSKAFKCKPQAVEAANTRPRGKKPQINKTRNITEEEKKPTTAA